MKKIRWLLVVLIALIFVLISYLVNNKNQCCDLIFQAGWPLPFYGGSGGLKGYHKDQIILSGLIIDIVFWFIFTFFCTLLAPYIYKKLVK